MSIESNHLVTSSNRDFDFFYQGLAVGKLRFQRCIDCKHIRNPPSPACPHCQSFHWDTVDSNGSGHIYSYTVHHHPPLPNFPVPHAIALVAMSEGVRLVGTLHGVDSDKIVIGMPVTAECVSHNGAQTFRFVSASAADS